MPEAFPKISKIQYEGPKSRNPLAFRWYNPDELVEREKIEVLHDARTGSPLAPAALK